MGWGNCLTHPRGNFVIGDRQQHLVTSEGHEDRMVTMRAQKRRRSARQLPRLSFRVRQARPFPPPVRRGGAPNNPLGLARPGNGPLERGPVLRGVNGANPNRLRADSHSGALSAMGDVGALAPYPQSALFVPGLLPGFDPLRLEFDLPRLDHSHTASQELASAAASESLGSVGHPL